MVAAMTPFTSRQKLVCFGDSHLMATEFGPGVSSVVGLGDTQPHGRTCEAQEEVWVVLGPRASLPEDAGLGGASPGLCPAVGACAPLTAKGASEPLADLGAPMSHGVSAAAGEDGGLPGLEVSWESHCCTWGVQSAAGAGRCSFLQIPIRLHPVRGRPPGPSASPFGPVQAGGQQRVRSGSQQRCLTGLWTQGSFWPRSAAPGRP